MLVSDHLIDGPIVRAENDAVINVDQEDYGPTVIETWVKFAWREADFVHALVHVFVPYMASLLLTIQTLYQLKYVHLSRHPIAFVSLWQPHVQWHFCRSLWVSHDEIKLSALPSQYEGQYQEEPHRLPSHYWGIGVPVVDTMFLLSSMDIKMGFPFIHLLGLDPSLASH